MQHPTGGHGETVRINILHLMDDSAAVMTAVRVLVEHVEQYCQQQQAARVHTLPAPQKEPRGCGDEFC